MNLEHWSLARNPFEPVPDSRFYFATPQHDQALAAMTYAARDACEPVLLAGPVGCGKTMLLRALRRRLPREEYHVAFVPEMCGDQVGLLRSVAFYLTHQMPPDTPCAIEAIVAAIGAAEQSQRRVVVMLDGWPTATTPATFNELRWLLNAEVETTRVCVLLTSENHTARQWPEWLQQRLLTTVLVGPLAGAAVTPYLTHRVRTAGHPDGALFTAAASEAIGRWSRGVPRLVNRVAQLALQSAMLDEAARVEQDAVARAISRLSGGVETSHITPAQGAQT